MKKPVERTSIFNDLDNNSMELLNEVHNENKTNTEELERKIDSLSYELNEIKSSKRYRLINKLANVKNKILGK